MIAEAGKHRLAHVAGICEREHRSCKGWVHLFAREVLDAPRVAFRRWILGDLGRQSVHVRAGQHLDAGILRKLQCLALAMFRQLEQDVSDGRGLGGPVLAGVGKPALAGGGFDTGARAKLLRELGVETLHVDRNERTLGLDGHALLRLRSLIDARGARLRSQRLGDEHPIQQPVHAGGVCAEAVARIGRQARELEVVIATR